ncbi:MAG: hypothetical protein JW781_10665 [Deltaproteobacteria bacterium]|nr:hypothetical protein [Candidatus Anaeroferrophillacea bacterium]
MKPAYDIICRDHTPGPLLVARQLRERGYDVLLVPAAPVRLPAPFFLPLAAGTPRRLLEESGVLDADTVPTAPWFRWRDREGAVSDWPAAVGERRRWLEEHSVGADAGWIDELLELNRVIDGAMAAGVQIPPVGLRHYGAIFRLLVRHEVLRDSRRLDAPGWMARRRLPLPLCRFLTALTPVISLFRFVDLPLPALAWGVGILLAEDAVPVPAAGLVTRLRRDLLERGAELADEPLPLVFDGKWCIGIGRNNRVEVRGRHMIVDGDHTTLLDAIPPLHRRGDVRRLVRLEHPGFRLREDAEPMSAPAGDKGFAAENDLPVPELRLPDAAPLTGAAAEMRLPDAAGGMRRFSWRAATTAADGGETVSGMPDNGMSTSPAWGFRPAAPAVMGGAFLPVARGYLRLYFCGWDNLPGFGLGGLIGAAAQTVAMITDFDDRA